MVFHGTSSKVIRLSWVSKSIKAERNGDMGLKIVSRIDGKNIDSTDNVKRGQKPLSKKNSGRGRHIFSKFTI